MLSTVSKSYEKTRAKANTALASLREDASAVALTEFAFAAPLLLSMGMLGTETANYVITHMQVSQIAMQVADNASRVGENTVLVAKRVFEDDINSTFVGAEKLGASYDVFGQGRIIISSLQINDDGGQWIAWQRCRGAKEFDSSYGVEGDGADGTGASDDAFKGMGEPGNLITASPGTAVMFVEVSYTYEALTPFDYLDGEEMRYTAAFNVRDQRDLSGLYQTEPPEAPLPVADCDTYSADRPS